MLLLRETLVGSVDAFTVIEHVAVFPLEVFAVIVAVPAAFAVTLPEELTVATDVFEEVQLTVEVALLGEIVYESVHVLPT